MPRFTFEETCTSRPLYEVETETLEEAIAQYRDSKARLVAEPVEENFLLAVYRDERSVIHESESLLGEPLTCPECQEVPGHLTSGVPGILAHMQDGRVAPGAAIERCDFCERFDSDEAALDHLRGLGLA